MTNRRFWSINLFLFLGILLSGCAPTGPVKHYEGPTRSKDQIAVVTVPGPISVTHIDGLKIDAPSQDDPYDLHLAPGRHTLTFRYSQYWGSAVSGMMVKSDERQVTGEFVAGRDYELTYKKPTSEQEAYDMASDFQATLVESGGQTRVASQAVGEGQQPVVSSSASVAPAVVPVVSSMPSADQAVSEDPVKRLKFWWLMASQQEREEFQKWMQSEMPSFKEK